MTYTTKYYTANDFPVSIPSCLCHFMLLGFLFVGFHHCDKIPRKVKSKEDRFTLAHGFGLWLPISVSKHVVAWYMTVKETILPHNTQEPEWVV